MHSGPSMPNLAAVDLNLTPFVAIWETTRACDLACRHCRAEAIPDALPGELSTAEGLRLLDELAEMGTPICVLSGGDPAKRPDLLELVRHGAERGMRMATIPAATPLLTRELVFGLKEAGLAQMALSRSNDARRQICARSQTTPADQYRLQHLQLGALRRDGPDGA